MEQLTSWHSLVLGILNFDLVNCDNLIFGEWAQAAQSARPGHTTIFGDTQRSMTAMSRMSAMSWAMSFSWKCFVLFRAHETFTDLKLSCAKKGFDWITCARCNFLVIVNSHISEALEAPEKASASTCLDWLIWDLEVSLENTIPSAFGELGTYFWHLEVPGQRRHVHYALVNINGSGIFQKFNWYESISDLFKIGKKSGRQASHFLLVSMAFVNFMMQPGWNAFCRILVWGGADLKNGLIKDLRLQSILVLWSLDSQETHPMTVSHVDSLEYLGVGSWTDLVSEKITAQRDPLDTCVPENKHAKSTKCASRQGGDAFPWRLYSRPRRSRRSTSCCDVSHVSHVKCATTLTHFVYHNQGQISKLTDTRS